MLSYHWTIKLGESFGKWHRRSKLTSNQDTYKTDWRYSGSSRCTRRQAQGCWIRMLQLAYHNITPFSVFSLLQALETLYLPFATTKPNKRFLFLCLWRGRMNTLRLYTIIVQTTKADVVSQCFKTRWIVYGSVYIHDEKRLNSFRFAKKMDE